MPKDTPKERKKKTEMASAGALRKKRNIRKGRGKKRTS